MSRQSEPAVYASRRSQLRAACDALEERGQTPAVAELFSKHLVYYRGKGTTAAFCPNAKTGSSSWMGRFLEAAEEVPESLKERWKKDETGLNRK